MKRFFLPAAFCAFVLLTGCISSERMLRNSPIGRSQPIEVRFDKDTVNLWPLLYRDPARLSVLWPFYDQDAEGFAIRPFYVNDGKEHSFLWPLSGWNSKEGWALNAYWRADDYYGCWPLLHYSPKTLWTIPFVKHAGGEWYERQGLLPLYYYDDSNFWYFGPVWRVEKYHGVFPLYWNFEKNKIAGPVWWNEDGEFAVFPLMDWRNDSWRVLLAWQGKNGGGVFPLVTLTDKFNNVGPVWWFGGDDGWSGVFPFYSRCAGEKKEALRILEFLWGYEKTPESSANHLLFPLWFYRETAKRPHSDWMVWPLVSCGTLDEPLMPSPLLHIGRSRAREWEIERGIPSYVWGKKSKNTDRRLILESEESFLLAGLLGYGDSGKARIWREEIDREQAQQLAGALNRLIHMRPEEKAEVKEHERQQATRLMKELGFRETLPETEEGLEELRKKFVAHFCRDTDYFEYRTLLGLLSWYERTGEDYWSHYGFGAVIDREEAGRSDFRILGFLYREKHDGEASEYLIPPFISVKRSPERNSWSFLYRLLHYENNNGKTSGSILFIPWGE